jgi:hypothetical protein
MKRISIWQEAEKYKTDIEAWLIRNEAKHQRERERSRLKALARIDKLEERAIECHALNIWRENKIQDMKRYINQYKFLPKSYPSMFADWIYQAKTGIARGCILAEAGSWVPTITKKEYMELIKIRGAHITDRP